MAYVILKLIFWNQFNSASRRWSSACSFLARVQLFFIGILGEYIGAIHTQVLKRPHVVELERNFELLIMKVVILCGGLGTRLREETEFRPKPMVPIGRARSSGTS